MIQVDIPGRGALTIAHLVLDFNGTIAKDGVLIPGVEERLNLLAGQLQVHILTADTFGTGRQACRNIRAAVHILEKGEGGGQKGKFINQLEAGQTATVGNGTNDALMLAASALGIIVLGPEGASVRALQSANVVVTDINCGLDLLLYPKRLIATLRK